MRRTGITDKQKYDDVRSKKLDHFKKKIIGRVYKNAQASRFALKKVIGAIGTSGCRFPAVGWSVRLQLMSLRLLSLLLRLLFRRTDLWFRLSLMMRRLECKKDRF